MQLNIKSVDLHSAYHTMPENGHVILSNKAKWFTNTI